MPKRVSYNKILENEFIQVERSKIIEGVISGNYLDGYQIDVSEEQQEIGKPIYGFSIFKDNEEIAYGKVNIEDGDVKCGGSYNEAVNDVIESAIYNTAASMEENFNELISVIEGVLNHPVEESDPKSLDPLDIIKSADDQETLDLYAKEYLMNDEYDLYIESKPDATFEDNKNYIVYLLENDPYIESEDKVTESGIKRFKEDIDAMDTIETVKELKEYVIKTFSAYPEISASLADIPEDADIEKACRVAKDKALSILKEEK